MFPYLAQKFIAEIDYWVGHSGRSADDRLTSEQPRPVVNRSPKAVSGTSRVAARDGPIEYCVSKKLKRSRAATIDRLKHPMWVAPHERLLPLGRDGLCC